MSAVAGSMWGNRPHARWPKAVATIEKLSKSDFPFSLTTDHFTQITMNDQILCK